MCVSVHCPMPTHQTVTSPQKALQNVSDIPVPTFAKFARHRKKLNLHTRMDDRSCVNREIYIDMNASEGP